MVDGNGKRELTAVICAPDPVALRLASILERDGLRTLGAVESDEQLMGLTDLPDLVILVLPGITKRAAAIKRIRACVPGAQIVVVAPSGRGHEVRSTLEAGAAGFVFDGEAEAGLALAARAAVAGLVSVPRHLRRQVERPSLSAREKQILGLVVMGFMNCEIADRLFLAESTVKSHLSSAFAKLGVRSRNEAVDLILDVDHGLGRGILAITGEASPTASSQAA